MPDDRRKKTSSKNLEPFMHEKLAEDEVSKPVRIRGIKALHDRLAKMSAKEIGDMIRKCLDI